jgi:hypothetical protein
LRGDGRGGGGECGAVQQAPRSGCSHSRGLRATN